MSESVHVRTDPNVLDLVLSRGLWVHPRIVRDDLFFSGLTHEFHGKWRRWYFHFINNHPHYVTDVCCERACGLADTEFDIIGLTSSYTPLCERRIRVMLYYNCM